MALFKCAECEKEISSLAVSCPNCGFPVQRIASRASQENQEQIKNQTDENSDKGCAVALLGGIAVVFIFAFGLTTCSDGKNSNQQSPEELAKSVTSYCMSEAGIPADSPNHAITPSEMIKFTECVDKQMYGK